MDETGFTISPRLEKVIAKKGSRQVHKVAHNNSHDHISLCPTISAIGTSIPPLLIYKGKHSIAGLLDGAPVCIVIGFTDSRYMKEELFQMYLEHFSSSISSKHPVLLMLDSHKSHISYTSISLCHKYGILLYALPPNTTHILQPAELPFATLKKAYNKGCEELHAYNNGEIVTKHSFARILGPAYATAFTPSAICNAFKATGIWPLNPKAINPSCLDPSLVTEQFHVNNLPQPVIQLPQPVIQLLQPAIQLAQPVIQQLEQPLLNSASWYSTSYSAGTISELLKVENESLQRQNELLTVENNTMKNSLKAALEELETIKNPGTCNLKLALRYPTPHAPQPILEPEIDAEVQTNNQQPKKKRKTIPFAQLLTDDACWQVLKDLEDNAVKKAEEIKQRKIETAQKRVIREAEKKKKQESILQRKKERIQKKEEKKQAKREQQLQNQGKKHI